MNVDPREITALNEAADAFKKPFVSHFTTNYLPANLDDAFVNLMQAIRRFERIVEVDIITSVVIARSLIVDQPNIAAVVIGFEGTACSRCFQFKMRRVGTCLTCYACGESTGC